MADLDSHRASSRGDGHGLGQSLWIMGTCAALSVGFMDSLLAQLAAPGGYPSVLSFFPALSLLVLAALLAFSALAGLARLLLPNSLRTAPIAYSMTLAVFTLSAFTLIWLAGLNAVSALQANPMRAAVLLALIAGLAALAAAGAWTLAGRSHDATMGLRAALGFTVSLGAASLSGVIWQSASTGELARILSIVAILAIASALLVFSTRASASALARTAGVFTLVVLASPMANSVASWIERPHAHSNLRTDAPVRRIVLLSVDTLRRDALTIYEPESGVSTPRLDALAADSLVFERAFSSAPWTVPSFVSVFTGLGPDVHGINHNFPRLPERFKTLAEHLREAGYRTAAIGDQVQLRQMGHGFDDYRLGPEKLPLHPQTTFGRVLSRLSRQPWTSEVVSRTAMQWLERNSDQDFFLWVHWIEPHIDYSPPPEYLPESVRNSELGTSFAGDLHGSVRAGRAIRTPSERAWLRELYDAEVRYTDDVVGRVVDHLKELDLYDETLIVFTTDHGEEFWEHGRWEHGQSLYDELVAVPLFIKLPGARRHERIRAPVSTAALLDTLLDLAQVPRPDHPLIAGSLRRLWPPHAEPPETGPMDTVYIAGVEYFEPQEAIVFDRYKYIRLSESGHEELYDLESDPNESQSLADRLPAQLETGRRLLLERRELIRRHAPEVFTETDESRGDETLSPEVEAQLRALGYVD